MATKMEKYTQALAQRRGELEALCGPITYRFAIEKLAAAELPAAFQGGVVALPDGTSSFYGQAIDLPTIIASGKVAVLTHSGGKGVTIQPPREKKSADVAVFTYESLSARTVSVEDVAQFLLYALDVDEDWIGVGVKGTPAKIFHVAALKNDIGKLNEFTQRTGIKDLKREIHLLFNDFGSLTYRAFVPRAASLADGVIRIQYEFLSGERPKIGIVGASPEPHDPTLDRDWVGNLLALYGVAAAEKYGATSVTLESRDQNGGGAFCSTQVSVDRVRRHKDLRTEIPAHFQEHMLSWLAPLNLETFADFYRHYMEQGFYVGRLAPTHQQDTVSLSGPVYLGRYSTDPVTLEIYYFEPREIVSRTDVGLSSADATITSHSGHSAWLSFRAHGNVYRLFNLDISSPGVESVLSRLMRFLVVDNSPLVVADRGEFLGLGLVAAAAKLDGRVLATSFSHSLEDGALRVVASLPGNWSRSKSGDQTGQLHYDVELAFASPRWAYSTRAAQRTAFDWSDYLLATPNGEKQIASDGEVRFELTLPVSAQTHTNPDGSTYRHPHRFNLALTPSGPSIAVELPGSADPGEAVYVGLER